MNPDEVTPEEAIEEYCAAFRKKKRKYAIQFRVESGRIRMAHVDVEDDGWLQWSMQLDTPWELVKKARMLALGLPSGDSRKPTPQRY